MELSIESPCLYVTWKIRDISKLPSEFLDSPIFYFVDDDYCLRWWPTGSRSVTMAQLDLVKLTSTFPGWNSSCTLGYRWINGKGKEFDTYSCLSTIFQEPCFHRSTFEESREKQVPGDTFTVLCSMRLREQSSAGNSGDTLTVLCSMRLREPKWNHVPALPSSDGNFFTEEQIGLRGYCVFHPTSRWSSGMEVFVLSSESPWQEVTWKVPDFLQLLSKAGDSLNSPEFHFAYDRYCLRVYTKGKRNWDTADTDLQLVRLTSKFPERIVLYKLGFRTKTGVGEEYDTYNSSCTLIGESGFYQLRSQLEEDKWPMLHDGTLTVLCAMRRKEESSAVGPQSGEIGTSEAKQKQEGLPGRAEFVPKAVPDSVSCAIQTELPNSEIDKENRKHEDWSSLDTKDSELLSERMKQLLIKGDD